MKKRTMIFVTIAAMGLNAWQREDVSAQEEQIKLEQSAQTQEAGQMQSPDRIRKGYPGYRLRKLNDMPRTTTEQKNKIYPLIEDEGKQLRALGRDRSLSIEQKKEKAQQIRKVTQEKIKTLLPPEEQKKYEASREKERAYREALHARISQKSRQER